MAAATFNNEDEEARYCLSLLRDGTHSEKVTARNRLALIFTRRGMYLEATELYEANVRAGVHAPELLEHLSDSYSRIGDEGAAAAAMAEARRLRVAARPRPAAAAPQPITPAPQPITVAPQPPPEPLRASSATALPETATPPHPVPPTPPPAQPALPAAARPDSTPSAHSAQPAGPPASPVAPPSDDDAGLLLQSPSAGTSRLPAQSSHASPAVQSSHASPATEPAPTPAVTSRMPAAHRYDPDAELLVDEPVREQRPRRRRGLAVPGPLLLLGIIVFLVVVPVVTLALLIVNPVALYLEGRPPGPTVDATSSTPARLKVAAGTSASWYVQAGRSVSGLWASPGLELTLEQELDGLGAAVQVTAARPQRWGETITIVERRGQGRANQDTVLLATFAAPGSLPPGGTVIDGRISGKVTAPRISESSQFNTTTESIDVPVQLVVVSAPELWLDWFGNSLRMFFQEDRWLLVTIGALLTWCVLAGGTAILVRARRG